MSRLSITAAFCAVGAVASVASVAAAPASAAPVASAVAALPAFSAAAPLAMGAAALTPSAVAGYLPSVPSTAQTASAKVKVVAITCTASGTSTATFVGLGSTTAAGGFLAGYLESGCRDTTPYYRAAVVDKNGPIGPVLTVAAGDQLAVATRAGRSPQATLTDVTTKQVSTGTTAAFTADTAQFTVQAIGSPFPTFTAYRFATARVGGVNLKTLAPTKADQISQAGKVQLRTSTISSTGGFVVKYVSQG